MSLERDDLGNTHTCNHPILDGEIDVIKLIRVTEHKKIKTIKMDKLEKPSREYETGYCEERLEEADMKYPVLIYGSIIIDGRHRYYKALDSGITELRCIVLSLTDIKKCYVRS